MIIFFFCFLEDVFQVFFEVVVEEKFYVKFYFFKIIRDLEVVEGSVVRFDCKIEGKLWLFFFLLKSGVVG